MRSNNNISASDVSTAAKLVGVPPEFALAIWQQESSSGRNVGPSTKGAVGGFQVMPATFERYRPDGDINDPVDNMMAGLAVMKDGLQKANGDFSKAAQFYYSGKILKGNEEGPNSGPGTPSVKQYGNMVAVSAKRIASNNNEEASLYGDTGPTTSEETGESPGTNETDEGEIPDMAGYTRGMNPDNGYVGPEDARMNVAGSKDYELDKYIRRIVDEEVKI